MPSYNLEARYLVQNDLRALDGPLIDVLWGLFEHIVRRWHPQGDAGSMKSNFMVFISNRIEADYHYLSDYHNAVEVILELTRVEGAPDKAMDRLLMEKEGTVFPPTTRLARARQYVSNEFIHLMLSLGGFAGYGSPLNYQGYIGGPNAPGKAPYLTYP